MITTQHSSRLRAGVLLLAASVALATACSDSTDPEPTGTVTGVVTAPNGTTPLAGATVTLAGGTNASVNTLDDVRLMVMANEQSGPSTTTAADGSFTLGNVPVGNQSLTATRGNFSTTFSVDVQAGQTADVGVAPVAATLEIVYVTGSYDNIQTVAREQLGLDENDFRQISAGDLNDTAALDGVGTVLLNCGMSTGSVSEAGLANLRSFMQNGGIVYASDLTYSLVYEIFQDELGSGGSGSHGTQQGDIVNQFMAEVLDRDAVEIVYNLGGWRLPAVQSDAATSLIVGANDSDYPGETLVFMIQPQGYTGGLLFTSFHNSAQATDDQIDLLSFFVFNAFE